jgi:hypothetical protein
MKIPGLVGVAMMWTAAAFAQTGAPASTQPPASPAGSMMTPTISVTGCVAGGSKSEPITLTHAMVQPFNAQPTGTEPTKPDLSVSPLPDPTAVSAAATQPQPQTPPQSAAATAVPSAAGTAGSSGAPGAVGTSGVIAGTAPAGSSASSVDGYRLSGVDMTSWIGRRVQVMGTLVPPTPRQQPVAVFTSDQAAAAPMHEIRVLSVQPVTGPCPK